MAQDKLLTTTGDTNQANSAQVNCWQYAADGTTCIAGQYFHSDNATPITNPANFANTATATSYGAWTVSPNNGANNGCIGCHHSSVNTADLGGAYLIGGHKNIMRKVVPGQPLLNPQGAQVTTVADHNGALYTIDWASGLLGPGNAQSYYLIGWIPEPDVFGAGTTLAYGSCGRCHSTGYRFDDNGPEPTQVTLGTPNNTYTKLTPTQYSRVPAGSAAPATSSWNLTGVQCERCHRADMQYDATTVTAQYNAGSASVPNPTSTSGRVSHFVNEYVDPSRVGTCVWNSARNRSDCTLLSPVTVGDLQITSVNAVNATAGNLTGNGTYTGRPLPKMPYALLCIECHQAYSTWTAKTAGTVGETHLTPLPGFESLVPTMDSNKFSTTKAATGQFSATFGCSVAGKTTYTDCVTAGGTVTYVPGGMSHGTVTTLLNSPHGRVTGYVDAKTPGKPDSTLTIYGGTLTDGTVVTGQYNTHFASENGVAGSCMGCHNVHGYLEGYVETNATNVQETLTACTTCHASHGQGMAHPTGPGTPYPDGDYGKQESCSICHLSKETGTEYHFLRINPDPNYNTFPSAQTYYTTYGTGKFGKLNTYDAGETYKDANNNTKPYPAVALDVDIACGQCHMGGNGDKNVNGGGNPYGIVPAKPNGVTPPVFSRAFLATTAVNMHKTAAAAPTFSPLSPYNGPATSVTISSTSTQEGVPAAIFYTTDGSAPNVIITGAAYVPGNINTKQCVNPCSVSVNSSETINTLAAGAMSYGFTPSPVVGGYFTIPQTSRPTISPTGGTYNYGATATITMSDATTGASIFYTTDGSTPTIASTHYTVPITVVPGTIKAIATATGYSTSLVAGPATFTVKLPAPAFSTANGGKYPGTYTGSAVVNLTDTDGTAKFCYTTNGTTPAGAAGACTNGTLLNAGTTFNLSTPGTFSVKAIAIDGAYTTSIVTSGTYTIR